MRKDKPVPTACGKEPKTPATPDPERNASLAKTVLRPSLQAAATIMRWKPIVGDVELLPLMEELAGQAQLAIDGNLKRAEAMLIAQAHTLDVIFNNLARRTASAEFLPQFEAYMRLGLKAQSQCRTTLETLATIKHPAAVTFVRQANVAHGPQQVNNGTSPVAEDSRARESQSQPNKLLEQQHEQWLDREKAPSSINSNSQMETLGEINRPKNT